MSINRDYFKDLPVDLDFKPDYEPFFRNANDLATLEAANGVHLHPVFGEKLMLSYVKFDPHSIAPLHQHPQEQITMVLKGKLEFAVGDQKKVMHEGDIVAIPSYVPHGAVAFEEGCIAIDVFAPPREGFKEMMGLSEV